MGFTPIGSKETYWSNEIILQLQPAAKTDDKPKDEEDDTAKSLTVTIKSLTKIIRTKALFMAQLRVENSSKTTQSFRVRSCNWDEHWKSNNDRVSWEGWDCVKNSLVTVKLEAGEAYEKALPMLLLAGKPQEKVSFKMGFTPIGSKQTHWSNEVTLTVEPENASKEDVAKLQGTWTAVSIERDGKSLSDEEVKKLDILLTFKSDKFMLMPLASRGPEHFPNGTFRIYTTSKPKAIDLTTNLPFSIVNKNTHSLGIYEVDGDTLKLLQGRPDQERPTEFKTMPKSDLEIIVFKRVKP
jgi:uncharacterized protein (TIGR03067 family)